MRYELTDYEWAAIRPMLPNKARGVRRRTIDVSSTASARCCDPVHNGTICRIAVVHHLLQPFRPVAKDGSVGAEHGRTCRRS